MTQTNSPLKGCIIAITGHTGSRTHAQIAAEITKEAGGKFTSSITRRNTHLVTTKCEFDRRTSKVRQAIQLKIPLVDLDWLDDSIQAGRQVDHQRYLYSVTESTAFSPKPSDSFTSALGLKRSASSFSESPEEKRFKPFNDDGDNIDENITDEQTAGSHDQIIPLDDGCPFVGYVVYINDSKTVFDATLNLTRSDLNCNKFYRMQVVWKEDDFRVCFRWGRQGETGQTQAAGNGSRADAIQRFQTKFREKTGLRWNERHESSINNKYVFCQMEYKSSTKEADDDERDVDRKSLSPMSPQKVERALEIKLEKHTDVVLKLIFNAEILATVVKDLQYDSKALPLDNLSKKIMLQGYEQLRGLNELIQKRQDDPKFAKNIYGTTFNEAVKMLTDRYFTLIPHSFGRSKPPVISTMVQLKGEVRLMESLEGMADTVRIMASGDEDDRSVGRMQQLYNELNLEEMSLVPEDDDPESEYDALRQYLVATSDSVHRVSFNIESIFRVSRIGEKERFGKFCKTMKTSDRRLLWHGSRCTNFAGILRQGLRIAPPEAPVNGYMFGKGVYLADMSSKSGNYCHAQLARGNMLLLLCEVELGKMRERTVHDYDAAEVAKSNRCQSTWGQGRKGPSKWKDAGGVWDELKGVKMPDTSEPPGDTDVPKSDLHFNEYVCYDAAQVRVRYLLHVKETRRGYY
ncbi:PARP-domain-containing protein [Eremomyces bilateralis CBS 781.70]|uniref:Poly [ADP-ribose] polymerase n=1 Tax=Eremomyces bilateralis CBS 781.70 TaxID=1392243 RepID=A0A6G1G2X9_9PEZI|nr:PARP-domain-containing protein [Eremomyces bilateralis CBS 781.70]KAF1812467.1 PARP-domain-containing protein [Eremomyces bilateralis CBS 781.70]